MPQRRSQRAKRRRQRPGPARLGTVLRRSLKHPYDCASAYSERYGYQPTSGSPQLAELVDPPGRLVRPDAPVFAHPIIDAHNGSSMLVQAALDHLASMRYLLREPVPIFGFLVMTRALLEASARSWYLLEPGIPVEDRVARWATERLFSLHEGDKLQFQRIDGLEPGERIDDLVAEMQDAGFEVRVPDKAKKEKRAPWVVGAPRLDNTELIGRLAAWDSDDPAVAGSSAESKKRRMAEVQQRGFGEGLYRILCAASHGVPHGLLMNLHADEATPVSEDGEHFLAPLRAADWQLVQFSLFGLRAIDGTMTRLLAFAGWDPTEWRSVWLSAMRDLAERV